MTYEICAFDDRRPRRRTMRWLAVASIASFAWAAVPAAATGYNETSGDLSNLNNSPTLVTFGIGDNFITGATGNSGTTAATIDRDYFTFTLLPGQELTAIMVLDGTTSIAGPDPDHPKSFIGIEAGPHVTDPAAPVVGDLLGYTHYGPSLIKSDILDDIGGGAGAQGFSGPLGAGTYSVWIQEANMGRADYAFNFLVRAVPEPSSWAMMLSGFGLIGWSMRRSQKRKGPSSARSLAM